MQAADLVEPPHPVVQSAQAQVAPASSQLAPQKDEPRKCAGRCLENLAQVDDNPPLRPLDDDPARYRLSIMVREQVNHGNDSFRGEHGRKLREIDPASRVSPFTTIIGQHVVLRKADARSD
jgi:hypothetical protein